MWENLKDESRASNIFAVQIPSCGATPRTSCPSFSGRLRPRIRIAAKFTRFSSMIVVIPYSSTFHHTSRPSSGLPFLVRTELLVRYGTAPNQTTGVKEKAGW